MQARYLTGPVISGKKLGRTIGFPTANVAVNDEFVQDQGVFAVYVYHQYKKYKGIMNIGTRPTFKDGLHKTVEVHILDFNGDLYDETLYIEKVAFIRGERKFAGLTELKQQLLVDTQQACQLFAQQGHYRAVV